MNVVQVKAFDNQIVGMNSRLAVWCLHSQTVFAIEIYYKYASDKNGKAAWAIIMAHQ